MRKFLFLKIISEEVRHMYQIDIDTACRKSFNLLGNNDKTNLQFLMDEKVLYMNMFKKLLSTVNNSGNNLTCGSLLLMSFHK